MYSIARRYLRPPPTCENQAERQGRYESVQKIEKNRTDYTYYTATGEVIKVTPADVGSKWIELLYAEDDAAIDADRREDYHVPVHYDAFTNADGSGEYANDKLVCMADTAPDPLGAILELMDMQEHEDLIQLLEDQISTLQPAQINLLHKIFYERRTNTDVAREEGVTEAAIRNRLSRIYKKLCQKIGNAREAT